MESNGKYVLGVDIGTGSAKTILSFAPGQVESVYSEHYPTNHPGPGYSEQDPDQVIEAVFNCIRKAVTSQSKTPEAISLSAAMHSLIAVDKTGKPLMPMMLWSDNRSAAAAAAIKNSPIGQELYQQTGTPIHAMSPLSKIKWLQSEQAQVFQKAYRFIGIKEYFLWHCMGEYVVDYNIASAMGLFDIRKHEWSSLALETLGISKDVLPHPVPPGSVFKIMKPAIAAKMGIPIGTKLIIGGSDGCMAQVGSGAIREQVATLTIGTSGAARMISHLPLVSGNGSLFTYALNENLYLVGGAINNGGNAAQWFQKTFYPGTAVTDLDKQLSSAFAIPAGAEGLLCLPYLSGERAPIWDSQAKGVFLGMQHHHTLAHFNRAMIEGICYSLRSVISELQETLGNITSIHVSGGFTASKDWVQLLCDVLELPCELYSHADASALGASLLGWEALGATDAWTFDIGKPSAVFKAQKNGIYQKHYDLFKAAYERLAGLFPEI
ncbi:hypothetical protein COR50_05505 [Chitinophaga caeni]|uniref:Gluconate kinase n=1 Tax=Chitinophaga caeni TaxID=2029983 RepID=A0A291QRU4_9BACT|nr:gluconokinase [Chitinophaga caeni]ATL46680.1 hypothetical protein COR50_05505 [Chitinophaga caeni]